MLKRFRIVFSLLILFFWMAIFLSVTPWILNLAHPFTRFQFYPALQRLLIGGFFAVSLFILIGITLLFGRVYCSFLCPLGICQDGFIGLSGKIRKRKLKHLKPFFWIRYGTLAFVVISILGGTLALVHLLEPYSLFGKFMADFLSPVLYHTSNLFQESGIYILNPTTFHTVALPVFLLAAGALGLLAFFTMRKGRLFCNSLCPVGTTLGLISKKSAFRITLNESACISCGKCERVCKAGCIDSQNKTLDFSRCVACFNCLDLCPVDAIHYERKWAKSRKNDSSARKIDPSRREFLSEGKKLLTGLSLGILFPVLSKCTKKYPNLPPGTRKNPIIPPGARSLKHFQSNCIACHLCLSSCPTKVLRPALMEYGLSGLIQPVMDYSASYCDYECNLCSRVCPTGAIEEITLEEKKKIQLGRVQLIPDYCIVFAKNQACGACAEHCPTTAVRMFLYEGNGLPAPEIHPDLCVGCGHCENVCPARPTKAIYVRGLDIHQEAKQPEKGEIKKKKEDDFPF